MKSLTLTSSLIAALTLTSAGQSDSSLRSRISLKEKEIAQLQQELATLKSQLAQTPTSTVSAKTYTVKTGDTISSIARRHGVSSNDLMTWNKITDPTRLGIGQVLMIQAAPTTGVTTAPKAVRVTDSPSATAVREYTIQSGDTFYSIARNHNLTVSKLRELNPDVSAHLIVAGAKLRVSGPAPTPTASSTKKTTPPVATSKPPVTPPSVAEKKVEPAPPVVKKETPVATTSTTTVKKDPAPVSTSGTTTITATENDPAPLPPVVEEEKTSPAQTGVTTIILTGETTFDDFANKHGTSTEQLNALNGWNLPKATVLARGSEIHVPK